MAIKTALKILVHDDKCTGCACCVDACPIPCYEFDEKKNRPVVITEELCIVCRTCVNVCPTDAIEVILEKSLKDYFESLSK